MCGIFGYIGQEASLDILTSGLKSLEYRGYDSAGLAYFESKKQKINHQKNCKNTDFDSFLNINVIKKQGKVEVLEKSIDKNKKFCVGLAHTRWATHGAPSEINAHPHLSYGKNFCVVHNGIIENFARLKQKYLSDITPKSATDTEIVAHLLEKFYNGDTLETLQKVTSLLQGSYALAVMAKHDNNKLFLAKKSSPLLIGLSKNALYFSSDVNTLSVFCENFVKLEDGDFAVLSFKNYKIFNQHSPLNRQVRTFDERGSLKKDASCFMEQEIAETPLSLQKTNANFEQQFAKIDKNFFGNIDKIYLVACGTAYHSCLVGKKFLQGAFDVPILSEIASEFVYFSPKIDKKTLVIAVSQSGETADTILALRLAKKHNAKTLAITNNSASTITFEADYSLLMHAGWERAVASTKAYVCQIAMFKLLAEVLAGNLQDTQKKLDELCQILKGFRFKHWANKVSQILPRFEKIIFIGRKMSYFSALEASLKLKEITYINSIAVASGELKHGTLALVDDKTLVIAIFCESELIEKNLSTLQEITARNGQVLVLTPFANCGNVDNFGANLLLPQFDEDFYPIISILPLQKLACRISQNFGLNPDMPKNLSKSVTVE